MNDITRQTIVDRANARIRDRTNAGINWGTNNYPAGSLPAWFGGTTAGLAASMNVNSITAGNASAANTVQALRNFTNSFAHIRRMWITILYGRNSGEDFVNSWNDVHYDGAGIGFSATAATPAGGTQGSVVGMSGDMRWADVVTTIDNLYNSYVNNNRNNTITHSNRICHTSCHDNCHCNRGRR